MKLAKALVLGCALVGCVVATGRAADSLSNSLTGFTGDSTQVPTQTAVGAAGLSFTTTADPNAAVTFDGNGAHFGTVVAGDLGLNYMRTNAADYALSSFVAEVTFTIFAGRLEDSQVYFGMGAGNLGTFGSADFLTSEATASFWMGPSNNEFARYKGDNNLGTFNITGVADFDPGTHRFRMTYDAVARTLLGEIDLNYVGGPFVADAMTGNAAINVNSLFAANGWPGEPSRIFFGGDGEARFRDLSIVVAPVVPVPAAVWSGMAMLGVMGVARWRKKKC